MSRVLELIGEIRPCCAMQTPVHKNSKRELNPLWCCEQPVKLAEERSDVVVPRRTSHKADKCSTDWSFWTTEDMSAIIIIIALTISNAP